MYLRDIARVLVKVSGLVIIVSGLTSLPYSLARSISAESSPTILPQVLMTIGPAAISIAFGLIMFWGSGSIADQFLTKATEPADTPGELLARLEEIAIAGIGYYIVANALGELVYYAGRTVLFAAFMMPAYYRSTPMSPENFAGHVAAIGRIVIGFALILQCRWIAGWRRRKAAIAPAQEDDPRS